MVATIFVRRIAGHRSESERDASIDVGSSSCSARRARAPHRRSRARSRTSAAASSARRCSPSAIRGAGWRCSARAVRSSSSSSALRRRASSPARALAEVGDAPGTPRATATRRTVPPERRGSARGSARGARCRTAPARSGGRCAKRASSSRWRTSGAPAIVQRTASRSNSSSTARCQASSRAVGRERALPCGAGERRQLVLGSRAARASGALCAAAHYPSASR